MSDIDPDVCPLCDEPNGCEHHCGGPDKNKCWCHDLIIPRIIFELVPPRAINRACICRACLIKHGAKIVPTRVLH